MKISKAAFRAACLVATAVPACPGAASVVAQTTPAADFHLQAQDLAETLRAIARQSGREILFEDDAVRGKRAHAVRGRFTAEEAVRAAVAGSGLIMEVRAGALLVRASPRSEIDAVPGKDDEITVTGSRIRGADGPSPMIVTTRRSLEQEGIPDLVGFARIIPQNFTGGQNPGVAGGGDQGGQNNLNNSTTLNLRGLGSDATLTLINGHRLPYDALNQGVDISAIPLAAVERIEIITDGASALYGSDAVSGVANILLRHDFDGLQVSGRVGTATDGGYVQQQYDAVTGGRWETGGLMAALGYAKGTPILAGQRSYTNKLNAGQMLMSRNRQTSFVLAGHQRLTKDATLSIDAQYADRRSEKAVAFTTAADPATNGQISRPRVRSWAITPDLRIALGAGWEAGLEMTQGASRTEIPSTRATATTRSVGDVRYENRLSNYEASAEGPLLDLPGGDARLAVGGGYRRFGLGIYSASTSAGVTRVSRKADERRESLFGYGELSLPLVGTDNRMAFVDALRLSAAVRYERYEGIDEVATPKLGLVYAPHRDVTMRFSWGKSFKIPTLNQVNQVREGALFAGTLFAPQPTPPLPAGATVLVLSGGNPDLQAERSTSTTLSFEFRPRFLDGLTLEASYFDIDYRGRIASPVPSILSALSGSTDTDLIVQSPTQQQLADIIAALPLGVSNQSGAAYNPARVAAILDASLRNTAYEHARGVDLALEYIARFSTGSQLRLAASASYLDDDRQLRPGQPLVPRAGVIFTPPHWRARGSANWESDAVQLSGSLNFAGSTLDNRFTPLTTVGTYTTLDISAAYRPAAAHGLLHDLELRVTAQNLFDERPDLIRTSDPAGIPYDSTNQSPIGRFVSFSVSKKW